MKLNLKKIKKVLCTTLSLLLATGLLLIIGMGVMLFIIKHEVMSLEITIKNVKRSLSLLEQEITILTSEWTYLTQPERMEKMMHHLKDLAPLRAAQIVKKI